MTGSAEKGLVYMRSVKTVLKCTFGQHLFFITPSHYSHVMDKDSFFFIPEVQHFDAMSIYK